MTPKEPKVCAKCHTKRDVFYLRWDFGNSKWVCISMGGCSKRQLRNAR